ncbi:hypothetical protein JCM10207_006462 [Rhodosporidiobolus poonsookiae]
MQSHPPSNLLQPSRPTTATHSSDTTSFGSPSLLAGSARTPPLPASPPLPGRLVDVLPTFSKYAPLRGTVRIRVEETTFYCHREVLALASPFFEGVLRGGWKETETTTPAGERSDERGSPSRTSVDYAEEEALEGVPDAPLPRASPPPSTIGDLTASMAASVLSPSIVTESYEDDDEVEEFVECRLRICEENAACFQDLLCHVYPRLDCLIGWTNVEDLIRMAAKFDIPSLSNACLAFLLPSAAGRPVLCMRLAEENHIPELYKEASRYVLDNYGNWTPEELAILSPATLLKLERRRSWFLERLLKLGQVQIVREYACHGACDDAGRCARLVAEKWGSAFSSAFRFGTPQPSIIYRSLRLLEPSLSSPALHLPFTLCQNHARLWVADLFDRMFQQLILPARNWTSLTLNGLPASASANPGSSNFSFLRSGDTASTQKNSARYFLYIELVESAAGTGEGRRTREHRMGSSA